MKKKSKKVTKADGKAAAPRLDKYAKGGVVKMKGGAGGGLGRLEKAADAKKTK